MRRYSFLTLVKNDQTLWHLCFTKKRAPKSVILHIYFFIAYILLKVFYFCKCQNMLNILLCLLSTFEKSIICCFPSQMYCALLFFFISSPVLLEFSTVARNRKIDPAFLTASLFSHSHYSTIKGGLSVLTHQRLLSVRRGRQCTAMHT